jgi:heat shock protein HslJ
MDAQPPTSSAALHAGPATLEGTEWRLTDHLGAQGELVAVPGDVMATATFADGRVAGSTGCNRYHGTYLADRSALSVGSLAMTMMACEPERTAVERAFTAAIGTAATYAVAGDVLELAGTDGRVALRFQAAPAPSLAGTRWIATGINNGRGGVASVLEGVEVSAQFDPDGRVAGSGGCNRYSGPYNVDGAALAIGPLAATMMACLAPEGAGGQEAAYFAALGRVATWSVGEGRLQLRDADGALQVEFRAADGT